MEQDQKTKEAQEILNWAIKNMNLSIHCEIIASKKGYYKVNFLSKENKLIMPVEIAAEWISGTRSKDGKIHDQLGLVLRNLANY
jgi:hypothetical protein